MLAWRKDELEFLKEEKNCVDSLLRLCGKVKHHVLGASPRCSARVGSRGTGWRGMR
jgi:hypothetical protein